MALDFLKSNKVAVPSIDFYLDPKQTWSKVQLMLAQKTSELRKTGQTKKAKQRSNSSIAAKGGKIDSKAAPLDWFMAVHPTMSFEEKEAIVEAIKILNSAPEARQARIFSSIAMILDSDTSNKTELKDEQRYEIASSLLRQIIHFDTIKTGAKLTCEAANAEKIMAHTYPQRYADIVARLAVEGQYTIQFQDGQSRSIAVQMTADGNLSGKTDAAFIRSYASELFQNFAMNIAMDEGSNYCSYTPGSRESRNERDQVPDGVSKTRDTGERIEKSDPWFWESKMEKFNGLNAVQKDRIFQTLF